MKNSFQKNSQPQTAAVILRVYIAWVTKCCLILACILFLSPTSKAQGGGWTLAKNQNNVAVYYKTEVCSADTFVFLKIVNSGSTDKSVAWSLWGGTPGNVFTSTGSQERSGSCASGPFLGEAIPSGKTSADIDLIITIQ